MIDAEVLISTNNKHAEEMLYCVKACFGDIILSYSIDHGY